MSIDHRNTAAYLLDEAPRIMREWAQRVRGEISASRQQQPLVLNNNLKLFLGEVAWALDPVTDSPARISGRTLSEDHGSSRAKLAEYDIEAVFLEYRILRRTILEVLSEAHPLSLAEREVINDALERSVQESVGQFAAAQQQLERARTEEALRIAAELRTAYERERRIAQVLQRPLRLQVAEDAIAGLSLATFYEPAWDEAEVGGDFFDVVPLAGGRVALVVGDTCGKGLEAAVHNTHVKDVLRAFLRESPQSPGPVLARLNNVVCDIAKEQASHEGRFVVLALLMLDPGSGKALYATAGAEPLLVIRSCGGAEAVEHPALPLGIEEGVVYEDTLLWLEPGDTAVMLTDGITEARNGGELLGYPGMMRIAAEAVRSRSLQDAGRSLIEAARSYAQGKLADDVCLLLARRR